MTIREIITVLYFIPAAGFTIATRIVFGRMLDAVNDKLPEAEKWTRWKIFLSRTSNTRVAAFYNRFYPNGNLARLYWVCNGFSVLCLAGGLLCVAIAGKQ